MLFKPENKALLQHVLRSHMLAGSYHFNAIETAIRSQGGKAVLTTQGGGKLAFVMNGQRNILVLDEHHDIAGINVYDVYQSNGIINVIDTVLMPA